MNPGQVGCQVRTVGDCGEAWVIHQARERAGVMPPSVTMGIGDDAAVLEPPDGRRLLISQDMLVEGVHFRRDWLPAEVIGHKAAAVNISDIAAMGGEPQALLTALSLPAALESTWVEQFLDGFVAEARRHGAVLVGGDTVGARNQVVVDVAIVGWAGRPVGRRGAQVGDVLVVTGDVGGSRAGLALLAAGVRWPGQTDVERTALARHGLPIPRVAAGAILARRAHALTDVSDGLLGEVGALVNPMHLGAVVDEARVPTARVCHAVAGSGEAARAWALSGGEDYELLAALPRDQVRWARDALQAIGVGLTAIGEVVGTSGVRLTRAGREVLPDDPVWEPAFDHFARGGRE